MFWKNSKPKESSSTAIVRQDSRTTVKTSTAQSETTSTSVQNDTIFNDNNNTVAYRTTTQTVTHQQQARITEILRRYTPTPEELAEMRAAIFGETKTTTTSSSKRKPTQLPAIEYVGGVTSNNKSPLSPLVFNYDSPRAYSTTTTTTSGGGSSRGKPTTPTIVKIQTTTVTSKEGRTVTSQVQQQRIQLGGSRPYNLSSPQTTRRLTAATVTPMTANFEDKRQLDAKPFNLSSPKSPISTKLLPATKGSTAFGGGSSVYQSPYLQRSIYAPTTPPITKSATTAKTRLEPPPKVKPATNTKLNWLSAPVISTTTTHKGSNNSNINTSASSTPRFGGTATNLSAKTIAFSTTPSVSSNGITSKKKPKLQPGYAYIFNNETFDNPSNEYRVGSSADVKLLRNTFEEYKLKVNLIENATLDKIASTVRKIETKDYSNNSCIVIVILSHGSRHEEVCAKDGTYSIDDKILFPILRNRTLNDKPKFMFIQACKGAMEIGGFHKDAVQPLGSPNEIFKCYSTFEGYVSYRTENGSIFIQSVCEFLKMFGGIKNIKDIMEMVCLRVKQKSDNKQIPAIMSTLTQPYVFGDYV